VAGPELWDELMSYWSEHLIEFAAAQVEAGASVIQLFDSWAGTLHPDDYRRSFSPTRHVSSPD
jgi:uroporphyrinogen decarboxylase